VSKCEREAKLLEELEAAGFPHPACVAFGEHEGRAFLLVEQLPGVELREFLCDNPLSPDIGRQVAELHAAGFSTPDLTAKHVFVEPFTLIDWQSAERRRPSLAERVRSLAALHASVADATPRERLRFLREYLKVEPVVPFGEMARRVERAAVKQSARRSVRDQLQPGGAAQRLVWLAGEAVCAVPDVAAVWPSPAITAPFYDGPVGAESRVELADGRPAVLLRFRTFAPVARFAARLRGRSWRSPGATLGRVLFHLERYGIPAPRLFAFGQRETSAASAESFVLHAPPVGSPPTEWLHHSTCADVKRQCEALLHRLHAAGCRLAGRSNPFRVDAAGRVSVGDPRGVRLDRKLSPRARRADAARLHQLLGRCRTNP
jgi:hypothetical protein